MKHYRLSSILSAPEVGSDCHMHQLTAVLKIYAFLVADTFFKQPHVFAYLHADSSITQANLVSITFMLVECLVCRLSYALG